LHLFIQHRFEPGFSGFADFSEKQSINLLYDSPREISLQIPGYFSLRFLIIGIHLQKIFKCFTNILN
jgi:hypothetical protein